MIRKYSGVTFAFVAVALLLIFAPMFSPALAASAGTTVTSVTYGANNQVVSYCCNAGGQTVSGSPSNYNYGSYTGMLTDVNGQTYQVVNGYVAVGGQGYDFTMVNGVAVVDSEVAEGVDVTIPQTGQNPTPTAPPTATAPPEVTPDPNAPTAATVKTEPCAPGCDCTSGSDGKGVLGMIERRGETIRARNKAIAQQIFKKPDNTMGMTCFDRALGVTSRIGTMFSDLPSGASYVNGQLQQASQQIPAANSSIFGQSSYPDMGMGNNLVTNINKVVSNQVDKHVENFNPGNFSSGSLSAGLGTTSLGFLSNMADDMQGTLDSLTNGPIQQMTGALNGINGFMNTLEGILDTISMAPPSQATALISMINGLWDQIEGLSQNIMGPLMNQLISQFIGPLFNNIMGNGNSLAANKCDFMNKLWKGTGVNGIVAGFKPLVGSGMEKGLPYFKVKDLLSGNLPDETSGALDFAQAILNEDGADGVLNKAFQDQQGPLSGPGNMPTWTTPPILTPGMSTDDIIGVMNGGGVGDARTAGILPRPDVPEALRMDPW